MMLSVSAARGIAESIRGPLPLADALASAAAALRAELDARGVAIVVRRDARAIRGQAGTLDDDARLVPLTDADVDATVLVSPEASVPEELALIVTLALAARFLAESAQTDGLTGIANRRTFDARLREEWLRAAREGTSLAVVILDIDYFKVYNDRHGHPAGDDALRRVAHAASASMQRAGDRFARYGGEEFAAVLPATSLAGGIAAAERIRVAVAALGIQHPVGKAGTLTVSAGVAAAEPAGGGTAAELLAAADRELYRAKAEGRDRVAADGYASDAAPASELPQPFSALVGRDADVAAVDRAIDAGRLVTIAGPAGVGKTRLALAVAHEAASRFASVRFVDALGAANREELLARVGAALGIANPDDVLHALATTVTEPTLIVLDGCERAGEACRHVLGVLSGLPLRVLATSRVPLGAQDEHVIRLAPLDLRATHALFTQRAAAAGIAASAADPEVAALLRRLAGSPFAIEIAVGRLASTSARAVLREFAPDVSGNEGDRTSLNSLLTSAVAALEPDQANALAAITTFCGSFSAADAASVIPLAAMDARRADALLRAITARSLLDAASHDGITRWRLIDPVRDAAEALPFAAGVRRSADAAHVRWCLARLGTIAAHSGIGTNRAGLSRSETVVDEVRAALDRALRDDALIPAGADLCVAAVRQWFAIRAPHEGRARAEAYLDRSDLLDVAVRVRLHAVAARVAYIDGDLIGVESHARAADALHGDGDGIERSAILNFLGIAAKFRGEYDAAERFFRLGCEMNARIGNRRGEAIAIGALGTMAFDFRLDYDEAVNRFTEAAAMFRELDDDLNALVMQGNLAESLAARGNVAIALPQIEAALEESRAFGNRATTGHLASVASLAHELQNDVPAAARAMREVLTAIAQGTPGPLVIMAFDFSARIAQRTGDHAFALRLLAAGDTYATAHALPLLPLQNFWRDPVHEAARTHLSQEAYEREISAGRAASEAQMVAQLDAYLAELAHE